MLMLFPAFHVLFIADIMSSVYPLREPFKKKFGEFHTWGGPNHFPHFLNFFKKLKGGSNLVWNKFALLWGEAQLCLPYVCL